MGDGRYGAAARGGNGSSTDAELAEIRNELRNQGKDINGLVGKVDKMSEAVTSMSVTMGNLVTKESCAKGRSAMADDLQNKFLGRGMSIGALIRKHMDEDKTPGVKQPSSPQSLSPPQPRPEPEKKKERGPVFWIGLVSAVITIAATIYGASTFISETIDRQERSDRIMQQLERQMQTKNKADQIPSKKLR